MRSLSPRDRSPRNRGGPSALFLVAPTEDIRSIAPTTGTRRVDRSPLRACLDFGIGRRWEDRSKGADAADLAALDDDRTNRLIRPLHLPQAFFAILLIRRAARHPPALITSPIRYERMRSGERRHRVRPGLDGRTACVVVVGRTCHGVTCDGERRELAVRVVTPDRCRGRFVVGDVHTGMADCRGDRRRGGTAVTTPL